MTEELNISEILKDKPQGTKLYSSACGKCELKEADDKSFKISFYSSKFGFMNGGEGIFDKNGNLYDDGECVVFPFKEMRNWRKFAWKKGDVLISNDGKKEVFFNGFTDDTYALFKAKHGFEVLPNGNTIYLANEDGIATDDYTLEDKNDAQTYINTIEERLGGKLNMETLEIEKVQPKFKDWDFITIKLPRGRSLICVFKAENDKNYYLHASLDSRGMITINEDSYCSKSGCIVRLSTEEEKMHFFDALAKKGKTWDVEKKMIMELNPKVELKPFDKVLVRDSASDKWRANLFGYIGKDGYYCCVYANWIYCIPYEGNEHLLGTTKDVEG